MTAWEELKPVLAGLCDRQPAVLASYPSLESDPVTMTAPIEIRLTAWAADVAEELHRQFGDDVALTVGFLPYLPGRPARWSRVSAPGELPDLLDAREVGVALDGPAVVASGHTLRHHLAVHNLTGSELQLATNGNVTATVVDPRTGEMAGGFSGAQALPLKVFRAPPGGNIRIPLLIGTASSDPRLGYTVPPGEWGIRTTLMLGPDPRNSSRWRTPILPLTITG